METVRTRITSPIGPIVLEAGESGIVSIEFERKGARAPVKPEPRSGALADAVSQLREYFDGRRREFALRLDLRGTEFQRRVWGELMRIPYGETISYGALAGRIGNPRASRAVGLANGANPLPIVIPCHRVIGSDGTLTGYGGGIEIKQRLLALERGELALL